MAKPLTAEGLERVRSHLHRYHKLPIEGLGVAARNPFARHCSSPRLIMGVLQQEAALVLRKPKLPPDRSGTEWQMAETSRRIVVRKNCVIKGIGLKDWSDETGGTTVVFVREHDGTHHQYTIEPYSIRMRYFGFPYIIKEELVEGKYLPEGTVLAESPSILPTGEQSTATSLNVIFADHYACGEDAVVISESAAKAVIFPMYQTETFGFGKRYMARDLYNKDGMYKPFPLPGDIVNDDGVIVSLFEMKPHLAPVLLHKDNFNTVDWFEDNFRVSHGGLSRVVGMEVIINDSSKISLQGDMMRFLAPYLESNRRYRELASTFEYTTDARDQVGSSEPRRGRHHGRSTPAILSDELDHELVHQRLLKAAIGNGVNASGLKLTNRQRDLEPITVTLTLERMVTPSEGFKFTDMFATKGVASLILPDDQMPEGVDIIMDISSEGKRMNTGRKIVHYLNSVSGFVTRMIRSKSEYARKNKRTVDKFVADLPEEVYQDVLSDLTDFLSVAAPQALVYHEETETLPEYLAESLAHGIPYTHTADTRFNTDNAIAYLNSRFAYRPRKLVFRDANGVAYESLTPIRVGEMAIALLDKVPSAHGGAACTSHMTVHGYPASTPVSQSARHVFPHGSTRAGEGETAVVLHFGDNGTGREAFAELMDSPNPKTTAAYIKAYLDAERPEDLWRVIDREKIPYDNPSSRIIRQDMLVAGCSLGYYDPVRQEIVSDY